MPWLSNKRPADAAAGMSCPKVPNVSSGEQAGMADGEWICEVCGNLNHAGRTQCNMRKCGAPKPEERWICLCGNENYAGRLVCNLRKCGMLKPGLKLSDLERLTGQALPAGLGKNGMPNTMAQNGGAPAPNGAAAAAPNSRPAPPGSWKCIECGNVNFPKREACNGRNGTCLLPRETAASDELPELTTKQAQPPQAQTAAFPGAAFAGFPGGKGPVQAAPMPKASGPRNAPPGSWVCKSCGNINFPTRSTCNSRNCGMLREEVDAGPPPASGPVPQAAGKGPMAMGGGGGAMGGEAPPGSWTCGACGNLNWPARTSCNRKSCGLPRP